MDILDGLLATADRLRDLERSNDDFLAIGNELAAALRYVYELRGWPSKGDALLERWDNLAARYDGKVCDD